MVLDGAMEHRLNRVISADSTFCSVFSKEERGFQSSKQIGALRQQHRFGQCGLLIQVQVGRCKGDGGIIFIQVVIRLLTWPPSRHPTNLDAE